MKAQVDVVRETEGAESPKVARLQEIHDGLAHDLSKETDGVIFAREMLVHSLIEEVTAIDDFIESLGERYLKRKVALVEAQRLLHEIRAKRAQISSLVERETDAALRELLSALPPQIIQRAQP